jgi:trans-aconitate 2-methyltransferase
VSAPSTARDWDAAAYDRVAAPQRAWAEDLLGRLDLRGDEVVLDAGCGTGSVTRLLAERVPRGRVIGVDVAPSMIARARETLGPETELIEGDLLDLELEDAVDAVFSNATFHWVLDHERLFERLHRALRPGGCLVAQCGGRGNIREVVHLGDLVAEQEPFAAHFDGWEHPWNFAGPVETEERLLAAGFAGARCWLEERPTRVPPEDAAAFMSNVCLGPHLDALPEDLRGPYVDAVRARMEDPAAFGYVRLNIDARRAG